MSIEYSIRPATVDDLPSITEIQNHYILHTHITFDVRPHNPASNRLHERFGFRPIGLFTAASGKSSKTAWSVTNFAWRMPGSAANWRATPVRGRSKETPHRS